MDMMISRTFLEFVSRLNFNSFPEKWFYDIFLGKPLNSLKYANITWKDVFWHVSGDICSVLLDSFSSVSPNIIWLRADLDYI